MARYFDEWLLSFRNSIANYKYYTDFDKVYSNVDDIKMELCILNYLIGSKNIKIDFIKILNKYPNVLKCIPILLAVRKREINVIDEEGDFNYSFSNQNYTIEQYAEFMEKTGLFNLIENHIINNLVDYVTGVEVGLDSNGRKNRGGHLMEDLVEKYIIKAGFDKDVDYYKEITISEIESRWAINLSKISNNGKAEKRFDFVIKTSTQLYLIETNFYSSGGSKLNETARSYKTIALETDEIDGVNFVWITDGYGWKSARNNLEETFDVLDNIYNIKDLENNIFEKVIK